MNKQLEVLKTIFKRIVGVLFLVIGVLSLILPLTPGILFIFLGLEILGLRSMLWQKTKKWMGDQEDSK